MANVRVGINAAVERENFEVIPFLGWSEIDPGDNDDLFFDVMVDNAPDDVLAS